MLSKGKQLFQDRHTGRGDFSVTERVFCNTEEHCCRDQSHVSVCTVF